MVFTCFVLSFSCRGAIAGELILPEKMLCAAHHDGFVAIRMPHTEHKRINMMKNLISHFHIFDPIRSDWTSNFMRLYFNVIFFLSIKCT